MVQLTHLHMTGGKTIPLIIWISVGKVMSLLFNMQSRFVIAFLPRSKRLLISWLQSPSAGILEPKKIKYIYVMEYYSITKKKEIMPSMPTLMDLEIIILSEVRERQI